MLTDLLLEISVSSTRGVSVSSKVEVIVNLIFFMFRRSGKFVVHPRTIRFILHVLWQVIETRFLPFLQYSALSDIKAPSLSSPKGRQLSPLFPFHVIYYLFHVKSAFFVRRQIFFR